VQFISVGSSRRFLVRLVTHDRWTFICYGDGLVWSDDPMAFFHGVHRRTHEQIKILQCKKTMQRTYNAAKRTKRNTTPANVQNVPSSDTKYLEAEFEKVFPVGRWYDSGNEAFNPVQKWQMSHFNRVRREGRQGAKCSCSSNSHSKK